MTNRTAQDLLAERRANVVEARNLFNESDETARAMLLAHVARIDAELARREAVERQMATECDRCDGDFGKAGTDGGDNYLTVTVADKNGEVLVQETICCECAHAKQHSPEGEASRILAARLARVQ
jgi:hypothetical protein